MQTYLIIIGNLPIYILNIDYIYGMFTIKLMI